MDPSNNASHNAGNNAGNNASHNASNAAPDVVWRPPPPLRRRESSAHAHEYADAPDDTALVLQAKDSIVSFRLSAFMIVAAIAADILGGLCASTDKLCVVTPLGFAGISRLLLGGALWLQQRAILAICARGVTAARGGATSRPGRRRSSAAAYRGAAQKSHGPPPAVSPYHYPDALSSRRSLANSTAASPFLDIDLDDDEVRTPERNVGYVE